MRPDSRAVAVGTAAFLLVVALVLGVLHLGAPWMLQYRWREVPGSQATTVSGFWSPTRTCHTFTAAAEAVSVSCFASGDVDGKITTGWSVRSSDGSSIQELPPFLQGSIGSEMPVTLGSSGRATYAVLYRVEEQVQVPCDLHGRFCLPFTRHAKVTGVQGFSFGVDTTPAAAAR